MVFITADPHRDFRRIKAFCGTIGITPDDVMIILGDAGINFCDDPHDRYLKQRLAKLPITLFCVHGNHEMRPSTIASYRTAEWHGGQVYMEDDFPTLLFAMDGEIYDLDGLRTVFDLYSLYLRGSAFYLLLSTLDTLVYKRMGNRRIFVNLECSKH